ncbi:MAG: hypothetical protein F6K22_23430 [Okeania sp. SIO2F4]|nr:hypothetical protein [Okeania sp. SIO2F4]NES05503.1 hypothetical protein [Okeania sp. SIO2F4]
MVILNLKPTQKAVLSKNVGPCRTTVKPNKNKALLGFVPQPNLQLIINN